jgi:flagellar basal-body rod modification protein FlgD
MSPNQVNPSAEASSAAALSSDFETFLKMLTVQMENQDPLNPIESADFAVQLATFSGVEQQVRTNELISNLMTNLNLSGLAQLSGWVGMEARAPIGSLFSGDPITLSPALPAGADQATLIVRDASGREVSREAIPTDGQDVLWGGGDATGARLPNGVYTFEVETRATGELLGVDPVPVFSRIVEARLEDGNTVLVFAGGQSTGADQVTGLRSPPSG